MRSENYGRQYDRRRLANRLARAAGHMRLVRTMVEDGEDCSAILIQLASVRGQLESISGSLVAEYAGQVAEEYRLSGDKKLLAAFQEELFRVVRK